MPNYVAVWIDHKEARMFHILPDKIEEAILNAPLHNIHHKHPKGPEGIKEHPNDAKQFFHEVAQTLEGVDEILVVGPSTAKLDFLRYLHTHAHHLEPKIVGIETVDHPTGRQIVAYAKTYFEHVDRTR